MNNTLFTRLLAFTLFLLALAHAPAARAQTITLSGHHDNNPDGDGYGGGDGSYVVPTGATFDNNGYDGLGLGYCTVTVNGGTFNNNGGDGFRVGQWTDTITVNGGTFSGNGDAGLQFGQPDGGSIPTVTGGTFSGNSVGLGTGGSPIIVSGGTFSNNGYGLVVNGSMIAITGGTFSGNSIADFQLVDGVINLYGTFDGVSTGTTKTLTVTDQLQLFSGQLQNASAPHTFTCIAAKDDSTGIIFTGTIVLHAMGFTPPKPVITSLSPSSKSEGSGAFTLTVNGTGFASNSLVKWNGTEQTTTFVSNTKLTAAIPASLIATAGTAKVTVVTPHVGTSGSKTFTIKAVTLSGLAFSPATVKGGTQNTTGTVALTGPAPSDGAVVSLSSNNGAITFPASTVTIPAGATNVTFRAYSHKVTSTKTVTVTATYGGASKTATVTVTP